MSRAGTSPKPHTMPSKPQPFRLPQRFDSPTLAKFAIPGEPTVIVRAIGVGSTAPFEYSDRNGRQAIFRYEREYDAHVLKVPASVWNASKGFMAHELMDQRRLPHPLVVTVEIPTTEATSPVKGLAEAMKADLDYAWSWHCNIAMAAHDSGAGPHSACNKGAALFLSRLSDGAVDTTQHPAYEQTQIAQTAAEATSTLSSQGDLESSDPHKVASGGSIPPPDTTSRYEFISAGICSDVEQYNDDRFCNAATEFRYQQWLFETGKIVAPLEVNDSHEMDAPGKSEEASDVVVGQVSEQPGASSTFTGDGNDEPSPFSPDGSGTDMTHKNEPAGDDALPFLAGSAWTLCEKPQRLKDLAGALNTDTETLKSAILHPLSAVELGHAGWVKRREPKA